MKLSMKFSIVSFLVITTFTAFTWMEEGMWLLDTVEKLPLEKYRTHGLELTPRQIYNPDGPSIVDAVVLLSGGTGSFVSNEGLILTNHHVAFAGIQELSSVDADYLKDGFHAQSREKELSTSYNAEIVVSIREITDEVIRAASEDMTAEQRTKAVREKATQVLAAAKAADPDRTYRTSEMYNGLKHYLFGYEVLKDVRLVYAPPDAIGTYGGEVDNWMWPRHTGDFAFMRAYVGPDGTPASYSTDNIPYKPRHFLPFSSQGPVEGGFAMVMGFPGRTFRYREYPAVALAYNQTLPAIIDLFKIRIDVVEGIGKADRGVEIKYANKSRRLANTYKNFMGTMEGMKRSDFTVLKRRQTAELDAFIRSSPDHRERYGTVLEEMQSLTDEFSRINLRNTLYANITGGAELIGVANRFFTFADKPPVDSLGRVQPYTEKELKPMRDYLSRTFKDFDVRVDRETLIALMLRSLELPEDAQSAYIREIAAGRTGSDREKRIRRFVNDLYEDSQLISEESALKLMMRKPDRIKGDPFVLFARRLFTEHEPITARVQEYNNRIAQLRTMYTEAWLAWKNQPVSYPDANRTIRLTFGLVEDLKPRDAVALAYVTTLGGVMEKETGEDPFIVPAKLRKLWEQKDFGSYAHPTLGDVPVAFIANLDITGGNSGSPVINGKGEVIGCAFDGNWESVVGDYHFEDRFNRSINVDSRYMLFILDKFSDAETIMQELDIR